MCRVHSGKDVTAPAQTGTEKTFFFAIPLTENLQHGLQDRKRGCDPQGQGPAFTRELANQISKDSSDITKSYLCLGFHGGQFKQIPSGLDILVGTPGRIKDHLHCGKLNLT